MKRMADEMFLAAAQDLSLVGSAMLQQITTGAATITRYGNFATHIDKISVVLVDGTNVSAATYSYDNVTLAYDCHNLTEGTNIVKLHD